MDVGSRKSVVGDHLHNGQCFPTNNHKLTDHSAESSSSFCHYYESHVLFAWAPVTQMATFPSNKWYRFYCRDCCNDSFLQLQDLHRMWNITCNAIRFRGRKLGYRLGMVLSFCCSSFHVVLWYRTKSFMGNKNESMECWEMLLVLFYFENSTLCMTLIFVCVFFPPQLKIENILTSHKSSIQIRIPLWLGITKKMYFTAQKVPENEEILITIVGRKVG